MRLKKMRLKREMPSSKKTTKKDRKRSRLSDSDDDVEVVQPRAKNCYRSQFKIREILKTYEDRNLNNDYEKLLKHLPEPVKDIIVPYMKHVQMINNNFQMINSLFKANEKLLRPDLIEKFKNIVNKSDNKMSKFSDALIDQLVSYCGNDTVYGLMNSSRQIPVIELDRIPDPAETSESSHSLMKVESYDDFMDSDIDLQISEICDNVMTTSSSQVIPSNNSTQVGPSSIVKNDDSSKTSSLRKNSDNSTKNNDYMKKRDLEELHGKENYLNGLNYDDKGNLIIYTDGCCLSNGRAAAQAGIGVWFNYNHPLNVALPVKGTPTNNNAEIQAATKAILIASSINCKKVQICTDSMFLINCMTTWIHSWKKNSWRTADKQPVKNRESLQELESAIALMDSVTWKHIPGHKGHVGNEEADNLAKQGAQSYRR